MSQLRRPRITVYVDASQPLTEPGGSSHRYQVSGLTHKENTHHVCYACGSYAGRIKINSPKRKAGH